ncbi:MAG: T9SS type A sorting domain-containing protein [Candidatus Cloacimonadota bacterium]|nr:MAG: T9SS type A sorting domain-containing protein [Candidatus Cloacimonadota bacterium]
MKNLNKIFVAIILIIFLSIVNSFGYNDANIWRYHSGSETDIYTVPGGQEFWLYGIIYSGNSRSDFKVDGNFFCRLLLGSTPYPFGVFSHRFDPPIKFTNGTIFSAYTEPSCHFTIYGYEGTSNPSAKEEGQKDHWNTPASNPPVKVQPVPFSDYTSIKYHVPKKEKVSIRIFDEAGRLVRTLISDKLDKGSYTARWNGKDLKGKKVASGSYFCVVKTNGTSKTKLIHIK